MNKRFLSLLLVLTMVFMCIPAEIVADNEAEVFAEEVINNEALAAEQPAQGAPAEVSAEAPAEVSAEAPAEVPAEEPADEPAEEPADEPAEEPADESAEEPADEPAEEPADEPAKEPADEPAEEPADEPAEEPADEPAEEPTDEPAEEPADEPAKEPADEPAEEPAEEPTEEPAEEPAEELPEFQIEDDILIKYNGETEEVTVPDGVKQIGKKAFFENKKIKKVILPDSVELIDNQAFAECTNLETIVIGDESNLTTIGNAAFENDKKLDISFADGIENVDNNAFEGINTEEATEEPEEEPTEEPAEEPEEEPDEEPEEEPAEEPVEEPAEEPAEELPEFQIENDILIKYNGEAEEVTVPDGVKQIGKKAFFENKKIKKIILPDSVELINNQAFAECINLETVVIGDESKLTTIGIAAFKNDNKLDISFADGIENVVNNAFEGIIAEEATEEPAEEIVTDETVTEEIAEEQTRIVAAYAYSSAVPAEITSQPTDVTAVAGDTVSFSVTADHAAGYQWQSSANGTTWTALNGRTEATLTITLNAKTVKFQFRCVVTGEDGQTVESNAVKVNAPVDANAAEITSEPEDVIAAAGDTVTFTVAANHATGYQWQSSANGTTWSALNGKTEATMTITLNAKSAKFQFRCVVTGEDGNTVNSRTARVIGTDPAEITTEPMDVAATVGDTVSFTVAANHAAGYQWESSANGTTWTALSGKTEPTLTITLNAKSVKFQFRCVVTGEDGNTVISRAAKVNQPGEAEAAVITGEPEDVTAAVGQTVSFTVAADHAAGYQWESSTDGETWTALKGKTESTLTITLNSKSINFQFRCAVTGEDSNVVNSRAAKVNEPAVAEPAEITSEPQDVEAVAGDAVTFTVAANHAVGYQWESSANGTTWTALSGKTEATLAITLNAKSVKFQFRCAVTGEDGNVVNSRAAKVNEPAAAEPAVITSEPQDVEAVVGDIVTFTVEANHATAYKWESSTDGETWTALKGKTEATLTLTLNSKSINFQFRCAVTGEDGNVVNSRAAKVNEPAAAEPAVITSEPQDVEAVVGDIVTFTVEADHATAYQWESSTDGETWTALKGKTEATLTLTLNSKSINFMFRCVVTGEDGEAVISQTVKVNAPVSDSFTVAGVTYKIIDEENNVAVIAFDDSTLTPSIPTHPVNPDDTAVVYTVKEIGEEAFLNKSITSITLPNTITVIRARAFKGCNSLASMNNSDN